MTYDREHRVKIISGNDEIENEDGESVTTTIDMNNIVPENSRIVGSLLKFRTTRMKYMTVMLGKKILELYDSEGDDSRQTISLEIAILIDKISELISKNIDDVTQLESVAIRRSVLSTIQSGMSKENDNNDLRYFA